MRLISYGIRPVPKSAPCPERRFLLSVPNADGDKMFVIQFLVAKPETIPTSVVTPRTAAQVLVKQKAKRIPVCRKTFFMMLCSGVMLFCYNIVNQGGVWCVHVVVV